MGVNYTGMASPLALKPAKPPANTAPPAIGATGPASEARSGPGHFGGGGAAQPAPLQSPYGSEAGPGILENWFNQRANGIDAASQYAMKRGGDAIDSRMAAGGSFNSGARGQQLSDYAANVEAQRAGQLDALAGGASGEHMGRLQQMFGQGLGLAGGQAGTMGAYDLGAANSMNTANNAITQMFMNKAGVDSQSDQTGLNNIISLGGLAFGGKKK